MFGFPSYYNQTPSFQDFVAPRGRSYNHPHKQYPPTHYGYPQQYGHEDEDEDDQDLEEDPYYRARQQQMHKQELLRQEQLRQQELARQRELQQREIQRQRSIQQQRALQQRELQRQRDLQRYLAQQQCGLNGSEDDEEGEDKEMQERVDRWQQRTPSPQRQPSHVPQHKEVNRDALATKIQKVFRGWQLRKLAILHKLKSIKKVEGEVDLIIQRNGALLGLPLDGSVALPADTQYVGDVPKPLLALELEFTSKLIQLDGISCGPADLVRTTRKALVNKIENASAKLDTLKKVYARSTTAQVKSDESMAEQQPAEQQPAEQQPAEQQPAEQQPAEEQLAEQLEFFRDQPEQEPEFTSIAQEEGENEQRTTEQQEVEVTEKQKNASDAGLCAQQEATIEQGEVAHLNNYTESELAIKLDEGEETASSAHDISTDDFCPTDNTEASVVPEVQDGCTEDEWVNVGDSSTDDGQLSHTETDTAPASTSASTNSTYDNTQQPQQISSLKNMCYSLCNQLIQKSLLVH